MKDETDMLLNVYRGAVEEIRHRRNLLMYGIYIGLATGGVVVSLILKIIYDSNFAPDWPFLVLVFFIFITGIIVLVGGQIAYKSQNHAKTIATEIAKNIENEFITDAEKEKLRLINKIEERKDDGKDDGKEGVIFKIIFKIVECIDGLISKIVVGRDDIISKIVVYIPSFGLIFWIILGVTILAIVLWRMVVC